MESGTILHLALLRKISNLPSNPNYRQKLYQPRKMKMLTENDDSLLFLQSYKKQSPLPLIQISNIHLNSIQNQKSKKNKKIFFQDQNSTISGWNTQGMDQNEQNHAFMESNKSRDKQKSKQQNTFPSQHKNIRRKNHSLSTNGANFRSDKILDINNDNGQMIHKSEKNNTHLKDFSIKKKYSLVKQVNISYLPQFQTFRRQQKTQSCLQLSGKLRSFQAFVSQLKQAKK